MLILPKKLVVVVEGLFFGGEDNLVAEICQSASDGDLNVRFYKNGERAHYHAVTEEDFTQMEEIVDKYNFTENVALLQAVEEQLKSGIGSKNRDSGSRRFSRTSTGRSSEPQLRKYESDEVKLYNARRYEGLKVELKTKAFECTRNLTLDTLLNGEVGLSADDIKRNVKNMVIQQEVDFEIPLETEGIIGPLAGIVGNIQSVQVLKSILNIKDDFYGKILIMNFKSLNFRKVKFNKKKNCVCSK